MISPRPRSAEKAYSLYISASERCDEQLDDSEINSIWSNATAFYHRSVEHDPCYLTPEEYERTGDGFSFMNYNGDELLNTVNYSKYIYFVKKAQWNKIAERIMQKDYSWNHSKFSYEGLYNYLIGNVL